MLEIILRSYILALGIFFSVHCSEVPTETAAPMSGYTSNPPASIDSVVEPAALEVKVGKPQKHQLKKEQQPAKAIAQSVNEFYASGLNLKPSGTDQSLEINRALESIPAGATFVFDTGPEFLISAPITIRKSISITGRNTQFTYSGRPGVSIIDIQASGVSLLGLKIKAPGGSYVPKSFILATSGNSNENPLKDINITECTFSGYNGVGINLRYVTGFTVVNNKITDMAYAGIACYSVTDGVIEGNNIRNITSAGTTGGNAYGITVQQLGKDVVSRGVRIAHNRLQDIPWEGIDTHGSENLYIYNNEMKNCAVGIAMVSTRVKSPQMVVIANNRIHEQGNTKSAIRFDGRANRKNASGIIVNNDIVGQHIRLENTVNLLVFGNDVRESETGYGIYLSGQNVNTSILNNSIQDVWSKANGNSYAIYFDNDSNTATIDGNRMIAKGFKAPNKSGNKFGFKINEKSRFCSADIGTNDFAAAKMKDYVNAGESRKPKKAAFKSSTADYTGIEDRGSIMLNDMSAKASVILPELSEENDGLAFILTNSSKKAVACNITITSMKDPSSKSNSIPGSSTAIFLYDYYAKKIWRM
jgi:hypothetical protein